MMIVTRASRAYLEGIVVAQSIGWMSPSAYLMAAPKDILYTMSARYGAPSSWVMLSDKWNRTPWSILAKASWRYTVGCMRDD